MPLYVQAEKLYIIQYIATEKTTFAINHGLSDGILAGQKSLFTSDNFSMVAVATKVTRFSSIWRPLDQNYLVPFYPGDTVMFSQSRHGIYKEIPQLALEYKKIADYVSTQKAKRRAFHNYSLNITSINGIAETTSTVDQVDSFTRLGQHYNFWYNLKFSQTLAFNAGIRYDAESLKLSSPALTIPVTRLMGMLGVTYYFNGRDADSKYFLYFRFALGYGKAQSIVSTYAASGTSIIMPSLNVGVELKLNNEYSFLLEAGMETIKTVDVFQTGEQQENLQSALLVSTGVMF